MDEKTLKQLLNDVSAGKLSTEAALDRLRHLPFEDLGFARVDHHRAIRCGFPEVVFCPRKTPEQVAQIVERLVQKGSNVLATRADQQAYEQVKRLVADARYNPISRTIVVRQKPCEPSAGAVGLVCAGTSDLFVAEEARETLEIMDQRVETVYDVGVAGLHRLLSASATLAKVNVVIVVAGMEGALPSVVGGLVSVPVIAVPTSVGYGASFGGLAALLGMLNSCASNVSVVNIDNGFGAGYIAAMINRLGEKK
ncbi:MAG: nickel pincer cofactor biosynthesis protein LarB [Phycisphaerae bacterium]|nr:nickel pincer cofactor biosynthesis protein LarB [Phycisphaerae bacterium]